MDLSLANMASFSALNTPLIIVVTVLSSLSVGKEVVSACWISSPFCHWAALALLLEHLHMPVFAVKGSGLKCSAGWPAG